MVTGAIFKSLAFDGIDLRNYGLYITGEAVFNAPSRDVEMVSIPGRSGAFALDNGRFENIEVSYPAGIYADNETDFADAISNLRNLLCSKVGYCRLQDEYNPNEYRMAVYKSGLEVSPALLKAGEFVLTFDCKPQRWLTSGEVEAAATNPIINPTLFPSKPLLAAKGYGTITMNGYAIDIANVFIGETELIPPSKANPSVSKTYGTGLVNNGDTITMASGSLMTVTIYLKSGIEIIDCEIDNTGGLYSVSKSINSSDRITLWITFPVETFTAGTAKTVSSSFSTIVSYRENGGIEIFNTYTFTPAVEYTATTRNFKLSCSYSSMPYVASSISRLAEMTKITADSTISALGNPSYIDCEIGEAYMLVNGEAVSLNNAVTIGSALPELSPGSNVLTYANTITELKITPRWWKV